jgi:teichuronic acid biosynthesis glycosyltransferase TuaC
VSLITFENEIFRKKTLLIIAPSFPNFNDTFRAGNFVKAQVEEIRKFFKTVIVISPVFFSFGIMQKDKKCKDYSYENVFVYYPICWYIPFFWFDKLFVDNRLNIVDNLIKKLNLKFDLVHAHFTWPSGYIGVRLKKKFGKPIIITIHENGDWFNHEVTINHPLINATWSGANALIRVNKKDLPVLRRFNEYVYAITNGFSPVFHPVDMRIARKQLDLPLDKKIIFSLGNLIQRKGFNYLIDAMGQIDTHGTDTLCYIGGFGPEMAKLQKQIDRLHLGHKVKLLGSLPNNQLTLWMNAGDIFVLPSLNEGNPTVMFEALGCGKPFVGTMVGGVSEVIISDEYGLLVEPADPEDLAKKILMALDREWDQEKILAYAERYSWENIAREILAVYVQVYRA